jgi:AraC family transcriptional activator of tynA and feaB
MLEHCAEDRISRRALESADTYDQWLSFIQRHIFEYKLSQSVPRERSFYFEARARTHHDWSIGRISTRLARAQLSRGSAEISRQSRARYVAYISLTGEIDFQQLHRRACLRPKFITLVSGTEHLLHNKPSTDNDTVVFTMPGEFVQQQLVRPEDVCTRLCSTVDGVGQLAHQSVLTLQQTAASMSPAEFESAARMVGELVLLAFGRASDASLTHPSVRASTLARVKRIIRARLTDPGLSLAQIALECGISLSYLHNLFRDERLTAREYLNTERLQLARRQLELAAVSGSTVTDVAFGCGFCNLSQFSTAFNAAFSVTPREVLRAVRGGERQT